MLTTIISSSARYQPLAASSARRENHHTDEVHYRQVSEDSYFVGGDQRPPSPYWPRLTRSRCMIVLVVTLVALTIVLSTVLCTRSSQTVVLASSSTIVDPDFNATLDEWLRGGRSEEDGVKRRLPHAIIIGVRKGGSRALLAFLNVHPDLIAASHELHFFDDDDRFQHGLDWYRQQMPYSYPSQLTIEKTPGYFSSPDAPRRVHDINSTIKLLLIVRDPVERAVSDWLQIYLKNKSEANKRHTPNKHSLRPFEVLAFNYATDSVREGYSAVERSLYYRYMDNWLRYFKRDQFFVVDGDLMMRKPWLELQAVEKFLNISPYIKKNMFVFNETKGFFCVRKSKINTHCLGPSKGRTHPPVDQYVVERLKEYYAPYNEQFFQLVGRDFGWND